MKWKSKALFSILLSALILTASIPVITGISPTISAAAAKNTGYVDGGDISTTGLIWRYDSEMKKQPTRFQAGSGTVIWEPEVSSDGTVTKATLILDGAQITTNSSCIVLPTPIIEDRKIDITIVLKGKNELTCNNTNSQVMDLSVHPTTIQEEDSSASLSILGGDIGIWCKKLTIDHVSNLSITGFNNRGIGVQSFGECITISDSTVTIKGAGKSSNSGAIYFQHTGDLIIENSEVVASVENGCAVRASLGNVTFTDSNIVAIGNIDILAAIEYDKFNGSQFSISGGTLYVHNQNTNSGNSDLPAYQDSCTAKNGAVIYYGGSNNYLILNGDNVQWNKCQYNSDTGEITSTGSAYIFNITWDETLNLFPFPDSVMQTRYVKLENNTLKRYPSTITIPEGTTVTIPAGVQLQNYGKIINHGTLNIEEKSLLNVHLNDSDIGEIENNGTVNGFVVEYTPDAREYVVNGDTVLNFDLTLGEHSNPKILLSSESGSTLTISEGITLDARTNVTKDTLDKLFQVNSLEQLEVIGTLLLPEDTNPETLPEITGAGSIQIGQDSHYAVQVDEKGVGLYQPGETVTITAEERPGYTFQGWTAEGINLSQEELQQASLTFTMPSGPVTLQSNFEAIAPTTYSLTVHGGTGASGSGTYEAGTQVAISAGSKNGYRFRGWTSDGGGTFADSSKTDTTFTMPANAVTLTAQWQKNSSNSNRPSRPSSPTSPETPSKPTTPTVPSVPLVLDTASADIAVGGSYAFLVKDNHDIQNIKVEVLNPEMASVSLEDANDSRGAKYRVTAKASGTVQVRVTYQGQSSLMTFHLKAPKGSITLDTASYTFAPGERYTIGTFLHDSNGNRLTDEQVQQIIRSGNLIIRDSRTGSIVDLQVLPNGNALLTAKHSGTCYILYEIEGKQLSVRIDVQDGIQAHGQSVRNTFYWL
jgi:uncharacterized repeat protein (TIGR02543 family)